MLAHKRHQIILEALKSQPALTVPEVEKLLGVSTATVRRDVVFLERIGKIVRTHGGVLRGDKAQGELPFGRKSREELGAKVAIAEAACAIVREGQTVFVDAGTTALEAGRRLLRMKKLLVFTNSIPLLSEHPAEGTRLVAVGGEVRGISRALVGAGAFEWAGRLNPDVAFIGASGVEADAGPCTTELLEADMKRAAVLRAKRVALLVGASKWRQTAAVRFADWQQISDVFSDRAPEAGVVAALKKHGVRLHICQK